MKFDVSLIIKDHIRTLRNAEDSKISDLDIFSFYIAPIVISIAINWLFCIKLTDNILSSSISLFAIFSALLFSSQVAIYGIFSASEKKSENEIEEIINENSLKHRNKLIFEINSNISYLILISCISILVIFSMFFFDHMLENILMIFLIGHFFLNLLMLVKRTHILFREEYQ